MTAEGTVRDLPIALCGFMGVGKSVIGRALAKELKREYFDSDTEVTKRLGRQIPELFASGDEPLFRRTESEVIEELVARRPVGVISLGGGALENASTQAVLLDRALLVHIDQSWEDLWPALAHLRVARPLLSDRNDEQVHELFLARQENYGHAHVRVQTSRQGVRLAMRKVIQAIDEYSVGRTS